ncbi:unnamed protein product [marine sediment metagenome]|uniref:Fibronectin type-III domain-containing protein n=1 Tax=marine sediment metagenome TaxID=412755 RepID=X1JQQ3_9ZZZZ
MGKRKRWTDLAAVILVIGMMLPFMGCEGCFSKDKKKAVALGDSSAPPLVPSNLDATTEFYNLVELTWTDNSDNETGFAIERRTGVEPFVQINTVQADCDFYLDSIQLEPLTTYSYRVRAYNSGGDRGYSNTASVMTK